MKVRVTCPDCLEAREVEQMYIEQNPATREGLEFTLKLKCGHRLKLDT